ncbi:MAG: SseB family protein [Gammaproteobacteria bacterium]|jgi:hypothetical protein|nr:SseB family protein [Gammaproteobacteria bacterium]
MADTTQLDRAIAAAYASGGKQEDINKVYLALLQSQLVIPVKKEISPAEQEPFVPLFAKIEDQYFLLAFDTLDRLQTWAGDQVNNMGYVELSGHDWVMGAHEQVHLCLNLGTDYYKEFSPDEVKRLKMVLARIDQFKLYKGE